MIYKHMYDIYEKGWESVIFVVVISVLVNMTSFCDGDSRYENKMAVTEQQ